jgi:4-oxalocrotonate tautomerase
VRCSLLGLALYSALPTREAAMPFVNIRLIEGRSQQKKDELAKRINDAISDVLQVPAGETWIVFEDIPAEAWYVGSTTVAELRKKTQT